MSIARAIVGLGVIVLLAFHAVGSRGVRVDVLDVGQGDAILITDGSRQLLVDAGADGTALTRLGTTMPFGDRDIDYALITHPHRDHYEGLRWIIGRYRIGTLLVADFSEESPGYTDVVEMVAAQGGRVVHVATGDRIDLGAHLEGEVLWPEAGTSASDPNESSIVVAVRQKGEDGPALMLLTGDATEAVEARLVAKDVTTLRTYVLKAGHHGSKTSSSQPFLEAVGAEQVAVSVGADNDYGHPSPSVIRRFEAYGYHIWRTDLVGSVRFVPTKDGVRAMTCRVFCLP